MAVKKHKKIVHHTKLPVEKPVVDKLDVRQDKKQDMIKPSILNIPNAVSLAKILLIPFIVIYLYIDKNTSLVLFLLASLFDVLDGYLARKLNVVTKFGANLDAVGDKIMAAAVIWALFFYFKIPIIYIFLLLFRDIVILATLLIASLFVKKDLTTMSRFPGKMTTVMQFVTILAIYLGQPYQIPAVFSFLLGLWCIIDYSIIFNQNLKSN